MKKYEKKLKWTIILFLGICAVVINVVTYSIITNSMNEKFMELLQSHIEHQYENCKRKMTICEHQCISFSSNAQLGWAVVNEDKDLAKKKLVDFYQNNQGVRALALYTLKDGSMEYLIGQGEMQYIDREFSVIEEHRIFDSLESNWYIQSQDVEKNISFFCPIFNGKKQVGCMVAKFSIDKFMPEKSDKGEYVFWEEHLAVASGEIVWADDPEYWSEVDVLDIDNRYHNERDDQMQISSKEITRTGISLVQMTNLKMEKEYGKIAIGLIMLFVIYMIGIYAGVSKVIGDIINIMINLKTKMEQVHIH